jgi:hypothetical protein
MTDPERGPASCPQSIYRGLGDLLHSPDVSAGLDFKCGLKRDVAAITFIC